MESGFLTQQKFHCKKVILEFSENAIKMYQIVLQGLGCYILHWLAFEALKPQKSSRNFVYCPLWHA